MEEKPRIPGMSIKKEKELDYIIDQADAAAKETLARLQEQISSASEFAAQLKEEAEKRKTPPPLPPGAKRHIARGTPAKGEKI